MLGFKKARRYSRPVYPLMSRSISSRSIAQLLWTRKRPLLFTLGLLTLLLVLTYWKAPGLLPSSELCHDGSCVPDFLYRSGSSAAVDELDYAPHKYREDGLLEVNPEGTHPITELILRSELLWKSKLKRASATLEEAVTEYRRRYGRPPPKGFDDWWTYVQKHNVQLPDEYDQIHRDLEPFWGVNPVDLQEIEREWEGHADSYTLGKVEGGKVGIVNFSIPEERQEQLLRGIDEFQIEYLADIEHLLPPFRAIFSPHDNPRFLADEEVMKMALDAAASKTYMDLKKPVPVKKFGWISACSLDSTARQEPPDLSVPLAPRPTSPKTFVHDVVRAMDPCTHPRLLQLEGQFLSRGSAQSNAGPTPYRIMPPQFAYCKTTLHYDILSATMQGWVEDAPGGDTLWEEKLEERLLWRGSNTGMYHSAKSNWMNSQRTRLVDMARAVNGTVKVLSGVDDVPVGEGEEVRLARLNPAMMDIFFAGKPGSCERETCQKIEEMFEFRGRQSLETAGMYKYIMDVDGNGWSSRFKRLITSNSLIFKATIYPEWFQDRISPWVHYVPVQVDLSDLYDALTFFRGDLKGEGAHDAMAKKIAAAGREWSKTFWRKEDVTAYQFRLYLEYIRVMSSDREAMSYHN